MLNKFRTPGVWGSGLGRDLFAVELDELFYEIETRVAALEAAGSYQPTLSFDVTSGQLTITADGDDYGPFTMPIFKFAPKGEWVHPSTYFFGDLVTVDGVGGIMVIQEHDTETPFDLNRQISGSPVYLKVFEPGAQGPAGADGADGADGAPGPQGERGDFRIDQQGLLSGRSAFDDEDEGYTYYSTDGDGGSVTTGVLYIMGAGGTADWTGPWVFQGPAGPAGGTGAQGPQGTSADWDAQGNFAGRDAFDTEAIGFRYLSSDGDDGATTTLTSIFVNNDGAGGWDGPFIWQGPQGPQGDEGDVGPQGPAGSNFSPDATGTFTDRDTYDDEAQGFSFLSTDGDDGVTTLLAVIFIKNSVTTADWSDPIPFQGPVGPQGDQGDQGPQGDTGPTGPSGTNFSVNATGTFSQRSAYDAQAQGFRYLSTNGDGSGSPTTGAASIYIKASNTNGDWGPRIPFQGPKGDTGTAGSTGAQGPAGPPGADGADGVGTPTGGTIRQVLMKKSASNFDSEWRFDWVKKEVATDTYTLIASDDRTYIRFTHASGCTVTVPDDVFYDGAQIAMRGTQDAVILSGAATPVHESTLDAATRGANADCHLFFTGPTTYDLVGGLAAA